MLRSFTLAILAVLVLGQSSLADEPMPSSEESLRDQWMARVTTEFEKIDEDSRKFAASSVAVALAEFGEFERAKALMRTTRPPESVTGRLIFIIEIMSEQDRLEEALDLVETFPNSRREEGYKTIAIAQARRGDIKDARDLLPMIQEPVNRNVTLWAIAESEAKAGKIDRARQTAGKITEEATRRRVLRVIDTIEDEGALPVSRVESPLLREELRVLFLLSSEEDGAQEALQAVLAAQNEDREALDRHTQAAMSGSDGKTTAGLTTTRMLIAVALAEAGREAEAKDMILEAKEREDEGLLALAGIFESTLLVHLLVRLEMKGELETLMVVNEKTTAFGNIRHINLRNWGAALVDLDRLQNAERRYRQMKSPMNRVHFSVGVLHGLYIGD